MIEFAQVFSEMHKRQLKLTTNNRLRDENFQIPPKLGFLVRKICGEKQYSFGPLYYMDFADTALCMKKWSHHVKYEHTLN